MKEFVTHDVKRFILEKPERYEFSPGQATDVAINIDGWKEETHPFTFTSRNEDLVLEFIIKTYPTEDYPEHNGMTEIIHTLEPGDELLLGDPWGTINYQGPGVFIAGGAGITPFIAIFREFVKYEAEERSKLFFANKKERDIILQKELEDIFRAEDLFFILSEEKDSNYQHGRIDEDFLAKNVRDFSQNIYLCGPPSMVRDLKSILSSLGAELDSIVFEE